MTNWTTILPNPGEIQLVNMRAELTVYAGLLGEAGAFPSIASAATTDIDAAGAAGAGLVEITGTAGISSFGTTAPEGRRKVLLFAGVVTVNHSSSLVLPGAANVTTEAGTLMLVTRTAAGWRVLDVRLPSKMTTATESLRTRALFGFGLSNNLADAANDVDVAAGAARSSDDTTDILLAAPITKRLDAAWAVGTNQGGLDTGSKANSSFYYAHAIRNVGAGVTDVLLSLSEASPTLPAGYTKSRRLRGGLATDASGNIRAFLQLGDEVEYTTNVLDVDVTLSTGSRTAHTIPVPARAMARLKHINGAGGFTYVALTSADEPDAAPSATAAPMPDGSGGAGALNVAFSIKRASASRQVFSRGTSAAFFRLQVQGYRDTAGRDE
ncbi:hypothetical protein [Elioraea sp.]|uniref:hypothetical protein n=1 Tax=Elioraea sp. TaxID=2185103 RepID=UPI0025BBC746|nr:hypothetical protein [Elioraea sp.]